MISDHRRAARSSLRKVVRYRNLMAAESGYREAARSGDWDWVLVQVCDSAWAMACCVARTLVYYVLQLQACSRTQMERIWVCSRPRALESDWAHVQSDGVDTDVRHGTDILDRGNVTGYE